MNIDAAAGRHRAVHRRHRHRLHVRAQPPPAMKNVAPVRKRAGRAHDLQHPRAADQPGRRAQHPDGRVPPDPVGIQVRALQRLGAEHALVVYGRDGMDEVSLGAATMVGRATRTATSASTRSTLRTSA